MPAGDREQAIFFGQAALATSLDRHREAAAIWKLVEW